MLPPSAPGMPAAVAAPSSPPPFTLFPALPLLLLCPVSVGSEKKKRKKHGQHCQRAAAAAADVYPRPASCATFRPRVLSGRADLWLRGQRRALLPCYPPLPSALLTHGVLMLALSHSLSLTRPSLAIPSSPLLSSSLAALIISSSSFPPPPPPLQPKETSSTYWQAGKRCGEILFLFQPYGKPFEH